MAVDREVLRSIGLRSPNPNGTLVALTQATAGFIH
jgi:hypothetical protein